MSHTSNMNGPIKTGDRATIIAGALGGAGPNVGKRVTVGALLGEHSQHGRIWRVYGDGLTTEFGATGDAVDCWLRKDLFVAPKATRKQQETSQ